MGSMVTNVTVTLNKDKMMHYHYCQNVQTEKRNFQDTVCYQNESLIVCAICANTRLQMCVNLFEE